MRKNGFTLIELMVVIVISMMVLGGLSVGASGFLAREKVNRAATEISTALNLARSAAVTNQKPQGFDIGLDYVAVTIGNDGKTTVYPVNNISGLGTTYFVNTIPDKNINVTQVNLGGLQFAAGNGKLMAKDGGSFASTPLPPGQTLAVTISSPETSFAKTVTVSAFGITVN